MATITGTIYRITNNTEPLPNVPVLLFGPTDEVGRTRSQTAYTGVSGQFNFTDLANGPYEVVIDEQLDLNNDGVPEWELFRGETQIDAVDITDDSDIAVGDWYFRPNAAPQLADRIQRAVAEPIQDVSVFPLLTQPNDIQGRVVTGPGLLSSSGGNSSGSLDQIIEGALHQILGVRPQTGDPDNFKQALTQSFQVIEEDGQKEIEWRPRTSYSVQTDMKGAVSGAQASIFARAQVALDHSLPLLEGLAPLLADADDEDIDSARAIVRSELNELVNEFGYVGGPRVKRVDTLFETLLGSGAVTNPDEVGGHLGEIRERFGFERNEVNTLEEEENLTNFLIIVDHVISLKQTWDSQQRFFDRKGQDVFLGTQLVLVTRSLGSIAETVNEVKLVMDSVFLGAAERESGQLKLGSSSATITIAELLSWLEYFATIEGPRYLREGGKDGAIAMIPTLESLSRLVEDLFALSQSSSGDAIRGLRTHRVQRVLADLLTHVKDALEFSEQLSSASKAPIIEFMSPMNGTQGQSISASISGSGFQAGAFTQLIHSTRPWETIQGIGVAVNSSTEIAATFDLRNAAVGLWNLRVVNPDGADNELLNAFTVLPSPDDENGSTPGSSDASPDAPSGTALQISGIRFMSPNGSSVPLPFDSTSGTPAISLDVGQQFDTIRLTFNKAPSLDSIALSPTGDPDQFNIEMALSRFSTGNGRVTGSGIEDEQAPEILHGRVFSQGKRSLSVQRPSGAPFEEGSYQVTLHGRAEGNREAITAQDGNQLTGNDGQRGSNFVFTFDVSPGGGGQ